MLRALHLFNGCCNHFLSFFLSFLKVDVAKLKTDYATLLDMWTRHIVHLFTTTSTVHTHITVDVHVDSYVNFCFVYLYWIMDLDTIIESFRVDLINNVGMVEFWNLDGRSFRG